MTDVGMVGQRYLSSGKEIRRTAGNLQRRRRKAGSGTTQSVPECEYDGTRTLTHLTDLDADYQRLYLAGFIATLVCVVILAFSRYAAMQERLVYSAFKQMNVFSAREFLKNRLEDSANNGFGKLLVYSKATCVQGPSIESIRMMLRWELGDIPSYEARDIILRRAVLERTTKVQAIQNTTEPNPRNGKAFTYTAFWSTVFNDRTVRLQPKYTTCLVMAGHSIHAKRDVQQFVGKVKNFQTGIYPCERDALFSSSPCRKYERAVMRLPVYKFDVLSIPNQKKLHRWIVKKAVESVERFSNVEICHGSGNCPAELAKGLGLAGVEWESTHIELPTIEVSRKEDSANGDGEDEAKEGDRAK